MIFVGGIWFLLFFLFPVLAYPEERAPTGDVPSPWLTGPLLTPSAHVVPKGHFNIEPYLYVIETIGSYNSHWRSHSQKKEWVINQQTPNWIGLTKKWDFFFNPQFFYKIKSGASSANFGDFILGLDYQIHLDNAETWYPAVKLYIREFFPTGKYQHGNPHKKGTDLVGEGSYITNIGIIMSRTFHFSGVHYLQVRWALFQNFHTPAHVKGFNSYGGDFGTKGKVHPGNLLRALTSFEYTLTKHWALACDIEYRHFTKTRFSGNRGPGSPAVGRHSSEQFSIAPAIEYNWSRNLGIIAGSWFSLAGRNSDEFVSSVVALNYYK